MKRLPPLPFSSSSSSSQSQYRSRRIHCLSGPYSTLFHTDLIVQPLSALSGVTVGSVRGCGLMVFDRQYSLFTLLVSISRGTTHRPMRQPDESVLFICASCSCALHCLSCDYWKKKKKHSETRLSVLVYNKGNIGFCATISTFSVDGICLELRLTGFCLWFTGLYMCVPFPICQS